MRLFRSEASAGSPIIWITEQKSCSLKTNETTASPKNILFTPHPSPLTPSTNGTNSCNTTTHLPTRASVLPDGIFRPKPNGTFFSPTGWTAGLPHHPWNIQVFQDSMLSWTGPVMKIFNGVFRLLRPSSGLQIPMEHTKPGLMAWMIPIRAYRIIHLFERMHSRFVVFMIDYITPPGWREYGGFPASGLHRRLLKYQPSGLIASREAAKQSPWLTNVIVIARRKAPKQPSEIADELTSWWVGEFFMIYYKTCTSSLFLISLCDLCAYVVKRK